MAADLSGSGAPIVVKVLPSSASTTIPGTPTTRPPTNGTTPTTRLATNGTTPAVTTSSVTTPGRGQGTTLPPGLAFTGFDVTALLGVALLLIGLGTLVKQLSRLRPHHRDNPPPPR